MQSHQLFLNYFSPGDIARDAGKEALAIFVKLSERKFQRNLVAALVKTGQLYRYPGNMFVAGPQIIV